MSTRDPLAAKQARAQELERLIDQAPDEATAGPLATELNAIMDELRTMISKARSVRTTASSVRPCRYST